MPKASARQHQESLLIVSKKTGHVSPRDFKAEEAVAVPLIERNIHLINCLSTFMSEARQSPESKQQAKESFARAFGHYAMLDSEVKGPLWVKAFTRGAYHSFAHQYAGLDNHRAAWEYRNQLTQQIEALQVSVPVAAQSETDIPQYECC
jgi:hypothetical protein